MTATKSASSVADGSDGLEAAPGCLFCGSDAVAARCDDVHDLYFAADPGVFAYLTCAACGSLWLEARPTGERLLRAYATYHTHAEPQPLTDRTGLRGAVRSLYIRSRFTRPRRVIESVVLGCAKALLPDNIGIDRQLRFAPPAPARVLDYGCGSGEYLLWLAPLGYTLVGAEYDPHLLASVAARGITIADVATASEQAWDSAFDHITLSHVLEHVPDPIDLIARLNRWLKPGGTLFLELPNGAATGFAIFGATWRGLEAPRHFALPSRGALVAALEAAGFAIVRQDIDSSVRGWMWAESLGGSAPADRSALAAAMRDAPPETPDNAEFLIVVARKPG